MPVTRDVLEAIHQRRSGPNPGSDLFATVDSYQIGAPESSAGVTPSDFSFFLAQPRTDPRRYGAVGDGVTDDTAALLRAFSVGRGLALPSGYTFATTGNLALATSGQDIVGPGGLLLLPSANPLLIVSANGVAINQVPMNCAANTTTGKDAVRIIGTAADIEISECVIVQGRIITLGANSRIYIKRNKMSGACTGGVAGGTISIAAAGSCDYYFTDSNEITTSDGAAIAVENNATHGRLTGDTCNNNAGEGINMQQASYFKIEGATCNGNALVGIGIYTAGGVPSQRALVVDCSCISNGFDGFDLVPSTTTPVSNYLQLVNCHSESNGTSGAGTGYNIEFASNSVFIGCTAILNATYGYNIQGAVLDTFVGCTSIANGAVAPGTLHGFYLNGATFCTLVGAISTNFSGAANQDYGIYESGGSNNNTIRSYQCFDNATGPIHITGGQTVYDLQPISASAQSLSNGSTIADGTSGGFVLVRTTNTGNVTGIILAAGTFTSQQCTVVNEGTGSITMAAAGTSNVADGVSCVIAAATQKTFYWNATALWYHS